MDKSITSIETVKDPVLTVWSNLLFAHDFMEHKEYKSARFSLQQAQASLNQVRQNKVLKKDENQIAGLNKELDLLREQLDESSPTVLVKVRKMTRKWADAVKRWI